MTYLFLGYVFPHPPKALIAGTKILTGNIC